MEPIRIANLRITVREQDLKRMGDDRDLDGLPGLVNIQKAINNGHRNSGFTH